MPALEQFLGSGAGLSASTITRLTEQWQDEQRAFTKRDLSQVDSGYCWADGIHVNIRLEEDKVGPLVLIGVRADSSKELITLAGGYRESGESWADPLRDAKRRGIRAPVLAVGDGALGFWAGLREVFPQARRAALLVPQVGECPCCVAGICAPGREEVPGRDLASRGQDPCTRSREGVCRRLRAKFGKAIAKITDDVDKLLAFYDYPAEHWVQLRTTNPIESTFATVRHRTTITRRPGSKAAGLAMGYKLIMATQDRWRAVNGPHLVALVRAGASFVNVQLVEREEDRASTTTVGTAA